MTAVLMEAGCFAMIMLLMTIGFGFSIKKMEELVLLEI